MGKEEKFLSPNCLSNLVNSSVIEMVTVWELKVETETAEYELRRRDDGAVVLLRPKVTSQYGGSKETLGSEALRRQGEFEGGPQYTGNNVIITPDNELELHLGKPLVVKTTPIKSIKSKIF